jgi:nicotinamidase-related amidase
MASIREGTKTALLVVDVQVGVMRTAWDTPRIIDNIRSAVEKARQREIPVIWVQHEDEELVHDSSDWQIVPELVPAEGEQLIHKHFNSSFEQTPLKEDLARLGINHIVLCGAASNWCIRATAYAALDGGYDLTLIKDGHTTSRMEFEDGYHIEAENIVIDLNTTMQWLSYPGRTNRSISVTELEFPSGG